MQISECEGYKKLLSAVEADEKRSPGFHDYRGKLNWVIERANCYAEVTGLDVCEILNAWEKGRTYWYMNYYQDCNQPKPGGKRVRIFNTQDEILQSIGKDGFRCPACGGVSKSPYECNSQQEISKGKICDWKVYGLLGDMGKGVYVFSKEQMRGETVFLPLAWEK